MPGSARKFLLFLSFSFVLSSLNGVPASSSETSPIKLFSVELQPSTISKSATSACKEFCPFPNTFAPGREFCSSASQTYENTLCPMGFDFLECIYQLPFAPNSSFASDMIPWSAGSCACPSNCSQTSRGTCLAAMVASSESQCKCAPGFGGEDCTQVICATGQTCNGIGTCTNVLGYDACICPSGWSSIDCTANFTQSIPPIPQLTKFPQYSDRDALGDHNPVYDTDSLATIWIQMNQSDLSELMNPVNIEESDYKPCRMTFLNAIISQSFPSAGIRLKGYASRSFFKKSFKLSIAEFQNSTNDQKISFYDQNTFVLKAAQMVPCFLRERLTRNLFYSTGVPVQRMSYAVLYINGLFRGVYVLMESINNGFLKSRFGSSNGALWKCAPGATLVWNGSSCDNYSVTSYEPKTTLAEKNCTPLVKLIDVVSNAPDEQFPTMISQIFDVDLFFRAFVVEVLTGNWYVEQFLHVISKVPV